MDAGAILRADIDLRGYQSSPLDFAELGRQPVELPLKMVAGLFAIAALLVMIRDLTSR